MTCSALVLHLYFALSVLWYGAVGTEWQGYEIHNTTLFNNTTSFFFFNTYIILMMIYSALNFLIIISA